jgi:hypothetical protein
MSQQSLQWEYCQLSLYTSERNECTICFFNPMQTQRFTIQPEAWEQALAQLGLDRWEVISAERGVFFFKRALP